LKCPFSKTITPGATGAKDEKTDTKSPASNVYRPPGSKTSSSNATSTPSDSRDSRDSKYRREETATVRITNLSEDTKDSDLDELLRKFGPISRIFLAVDKPSGHSKGFAFVNFVDKNDAQKCIDSLNGFGYDHLILKVEWAKPSNK